MNRNTLDDYVKTIQHYISARRISAAIATTAQLLDMTAASWQQRSELEQIRQDYAYLSQYALDGADDPEREHVYRRVCDRIVDLMRQAERSVKAADSATLYFSTLRYEKLRRDDSLQSLTDAFRQAAGILEMAQLTGDSASVAEKRRAVEAAEKRLFDRIWITLPFTADDESALTALLLDEAVDTTTRDLIVSAITMALLSGGYDARALYILLLVYNTDSLPASVRMRALIGWLLAMDRYRTREMPQRLEALLATVREHPDWEGDVRRVFMQFIRTRDTEKITRQMTDEVIPRMIKLRPDIYKKINESPEATFDPASLEENPEWQEMLERSGIADQMRRLQEMQEEGADVMMSAFSHLKGYSFFNDVEAWFLPFRADHSAVVDAGASELARLLEGPGMLCDSDRYSVAFTIGRMPQAQREMVTSQFDAQAQQMRNELDSSLQTPDTDRDAIVRLYVQNLYRFFRLFRRKNEFDDPFATPLNLATIPALAQQFTSAGQLLLIAEFYFKRGYYADALALMQRVEQLGESSVSLFQKMGYASQRLSDTQRALDYYLKAELIDSDNRWTRRRIAACYRMLDRPADALRYYLPLSEEMPDDLNIALHTGHCYLETGDYKGAINLYFKVEFLENGRGRAIRPIAWCSFLAADYERSADYYGRIPSAELTATDHLNIGHLRMATGRYRDAITAYSAALQAMDSDRTRFTEAMQADLRYLRAAGVSDLLTGIVLDTLLAS